MKQRRLSPPVTAALLLLAGCGPGPAGPSQGEPPGIRLRVTGGFAGVEYTLVLEGATGLLRGESCARGCAFRAGEALQALRPDQVDYLFALFREAGIHALARRDFGEECCDQFHYQAAYRDREGEGSFQGSSEALPAEMGAAVGALHALLVGTLPLVVSFEGHPDLWPHDPFTIQDAAVAGDHLRVRVRYGGGCHPHEFLGVAWGGWMESFPVRVRVFVSHDAFGDQCRALLTEDRYYDLGPLRRAYRGSYGAPPPGPTTLVILLEDPPGTAFPRTRALDYRF